MTDLLSVSPRLTMDTDALPRHVRQGDVLLVETDDLPEAATPIKRERGRIVLAYGEVTGHAHVVRSASATLVRHDDERYLRAIAPVVIEHEEHAPIHLPAGDWRVVIQREYAPDPIPANAWRTVAD